MMCLLSPEVIVEYIMEENLKLDLTAERNTFQGEEMLESQNSGKRDLRDHLVQSFFYFLSSLLEHFGLTVP